MRVTRLWPSVAVRRRRLAGDRQLPRVRAIGTPKRAPACATRMSQALAMARPPPTAQPSITATVGTRHALQPGDVALDAGLVGDAVRAREADELLDVRAGHEGLAAGAPQDGDAHGRVGLDPRQALRQRLVHREGDGVARGRPVEGQVRDTALDPVADGARILGRAHAAKAPSARRRSIAGLGQAELRQDLVGVLAEQRRVAADLGGVPESFTGKPMLGTLPSMGWGTSMRIARCRPCSLSKASG